MDAEKYLVLRDLIDTVEATYLEFRRESDRRDRRDARIVFYDSMRRVFVEDPLSDEEVQTELLAYLDEKLSTASDPCTDWVKKVFIQESLKKGLKND